MNIKLHMHTGLTISDPRADHIIVSDGTITVTHAGRGDDTYYMYEVANFEVRPNAESAKLGYKLIADATYRNNHKADLCYYKFDTVSTEYNRFDHKKYINLRYDLGTKSFAMKHLKKLVVAAGTLY